MHSYSKVTIFVDIEGPPTWPNEIGAVAVKRGKMMDSFLGWCPPQHDIQSLNEFKTSSRYSHGLRLGWLRAEGESRETLLTRFHCWLQNLNPQRIAANGVGDISLLLHQIGVTLPIVSIALPNWRDRQQLDEHQDAFKAKQAELPMCNGVRCPYTSAHYPQIRVSTKNGETRQAKLAHGSHCALYDAYEIALYSLNRDLV